jgi:hypothetical protein
MLRHKLWPLLRDYTMLTAGALLIAAAVRVFLVPNDPACLHGDRRRQRGAGRGLPPGAAVSG